MDVINTFLLLTTSLCISFHFNFVYSSLSGVEDFHSRGATKIFTAEDDLSMAGPSQDHSVHKRSTGKEPTKTNITSMVNQLNDSHQQLMVHWAGEGSTVVICLARDSSNARTSESSKPSAVYISYDYGDSYENKTEYFRFQQGNNKIYAAIDKFYNHPKFNTHVVFLDKTHKMVFTTTNSGKIFQQVSLDFNPIEVSFHPENPKMFLIHDDKHSLWATTDFGISWSRVQEFVKSYFWVSETEEGAEESHLLLQREEPELSSVIAVKGQSLGENAVLSLVIRDIVHLWVKGEFIFVTRKDPKDSSSLDLLISHKNGEFRKALFQSELRRQAYHIIDVDSKQIMVAVSHSEYLSSLYVSEILSGPGDIKFSVSLEHVFCYVENKMWTESWLSDVADSSFCDVHRVEGLRGVYIASQVLDNVGINPGVQHLRSVISWDWGGEWQPLKAPQYSATGQQLNCNVEANCSLHLSQKFAQLYPVTKSTPIMTSKSAPGLILATGTLGTSLKGHVGVYMSRDAGLTWHQVLQEYYLFNIGDHGGVLTAVKYFKAQGETDTLKYSTDEGENWRDYGFSDENLRIYGLMTEPGENTTIFTMFGSAMSRHKWLIIKVDLRNAFTYNCSKEDYKLWAPGSGVEGAKMTCLLGLRQSYERRVPHSNCYNGIDYDRPVSVEVCPCSAEDFECDFGFERAVGSFQCIRNKTMNTTPYKVPEWCKPGQFYNRTKGYLKIQEDACQGGLESSYLPDSVPCPYDQRKEFLLLAQKDRIVRFDLATLELEQLPVRNLQSVVAVEFDIHNNCVYWADIVTKRIERLCLGDNSNGTVEVIVEKDLSSVEGMALDWMSNLLYFVDGMQSSIQVVRTDINHAGRMRKTVLGSSHLKKPRGIALHPAKGLMFWTDWAVGDPCVSRAALDGSSVKRLFNKPDVEWPNGITVDYIAERIYFVDARLDYIGSATIEGKDFRKIIANKDQVAHPFAIAVFKDFMYWDDWKQNSLFSADKDHGNMITTIEKNLPSLMDLKVFAHSLQEGSNQCSITKCSHLCFALPDNTSVCQCPDSMELFNGVCYCPGPERLKPFANDTCPEDKNKKCPSNHFKCKNQLCIPKLWTCDGDNDCGDFSDEIGCEQVTCLPYQFRCHSDGKCISPDWRCDYDKDCDDGSDEANCTYSTCLKDQFQCANKRCISHNWVCDMEDDCRDGSDEVNCTKIVRPSTCASGYFMCANPHACIPKSWRCDGEKDCADNSDELNCQANTCGASQFQCKNKRCIFKAWQCDGDYDCGENDHSDEENCNATHPEIPDRPYLPSNACLEWMFECDNKKCVSYWWKCDGIDDCGDGSDEIGCLHTPEPPNYITPSPPPNPAVCHSHQFRCLNGDCIQESWVCDGYKDCDAGEDERHCEGVLTCLEFRCRHDGSCIPQREVCDGIVQCPDQSDEMACPATLPPVGPGPSCQVGMFPCDGSRCLPLALYCDGQIDCNDGFDEKNCNSTNRVYQSLRFGVDEGSVNSTSLKLYWWIPSMAHVKFWFLPAYKVATSPLSSWVNASWTLETDHLFTGLKPYTVYNLTVFVKNEDTKSVYPPGKFVIATTNEAEPEAPWNVKVVQHSSSQVAVSWVPPHQSNGPLSAYKVCMTPPIPPLCKTTNPSKTTTFINSEFTVHTNYSFWVRAKNLMYESQSSDVAVLQVNPQAQLEPVTGLKVTSTTTSSVTLAWDPPKMACQWRVLPLVISSEPLYPHLPPTLTNTPSVIVPNLAPGTQYSFEVVPYHENFEAQSASVTAKTDGEPLPQVSSLYGQVVKSEGTSVKVEWSPAVNRHGAVWEYGIYYGLSLKELLSKDAVVKTTSTSTVVRGLGACEAYVLSVGLVGPYGLGPLSKPLTLVTQFNASAPPKALRVLTDTHNSSVMSLTWSASCPVVTKNVSYEISVTEVTLGQSTAFVIGPTTDIHLHHPLTVEVGGRYNVCVTISGVVGGSGPCQLYYARPIPPPSQLQLLQEANGSHVLYWRPPPLPLDSKYHYVVLMSQGSSLNVSEAQRIKTSSTPFVFTPPSDEGIYSYAVILESEEGYQSVPSEVVSLAATKTVAESQRSMMSLLLTSVVVVVIICCILAVALGFISFRHRRLQHTFSLFANSHFSTRSGTATFSGCDGLDDEDSPVIRGFSDDEPLVIA